MHLYLVQHGEANKEDVDPSRGLTDKGFRDVSMAARYARDHDILVSRIFHSNKKRAMQTAQLFGDRLKPEKKVIETDSLAPMDDPSIWAGRISQMNEDIMLVAHLPYLAKLAGLLLCNDKEKAFVDFQMGGLVCLKRWEDGGWTLEWMVVPRLMG